MATPLQGMIVDGIRYELEPHTEGRTTESYHVLVDKKRLLSTPETVVVRRGRTWIILAPAFRCERGNRIEMFKALAELVNG